MISSESFAVPTEKTIKNKTVWRIVLGTVAGEILLALCLLWAFLPKSIMDSPRLIEFACALLIMIIVVIMHGPKMPIRSLEEHS